MFKRGKLAMMAGFRNLVPELRETEGLSFDVIAMPNLDGAATVGDISGLCISAESEVTGDAADFIAHAVTDEAFQAVTETGYIVPANTEVASSEVFLDETQQPEHASVFLSGIRNMVVPPFIEDREALVAAITPLLQRMLTEPGALDLEGIVAEIDEASRTVLTPEEPEEPGDGEEPTEEPSE
jgi:multiple sugar transport system substrate-binding protein